MRFIITYDDAVIVLENQSVTSKLCRISLPLQHMYTVPLKLCCRTKRTVKNQIRSYKHEQIARYLLAQIHRRIPDVYRNVSRFLDHRDFNKIKQKPLELYLVLYYSHAKLPFLYRKRSLLGKHTSCCVIP